MAAQGLHTGHLTVWSWHASHIGLSVPSICYVGQRHHDDPLQEQHNATVPCSVCKLASTLPKGRPTITAGAQLPSAGKVSTWRKWSKLRPVHSMTRPTVGPTLGNNVERVYTFRSHCNMALLALLAGSLLCRIEAMEKGSVQLPATWPAQSAQCCYQPKALEATKRSMHKHDHDNNLVLPAEQTVWADTQPGPVTLT